MIYDAAFERVLFDGAAHVHPARLDGMTGRTITVGSVSKEHRMIGWRVGWVVAPRGVIDDVGLVAISNGVCNVGIGMPGAAVALEGPDGVAEATATWQARRDAVLEALAGWPVVRPEGGWSLLVDAAALGLTGAEASARLLESGRVAATPMAGWGTARSAGYLRLVFSNEPAERLATLGARFEAAFGRARMGLARG